jgi:hypothetical protein
MGRLHPGNNNNKTEKEKVMKPNMLSSKSVWFAGLTLAALAFTLATLPAAKPLPTPLKPVAIIYEAGSILGMAADGSSQRTLLSGTSKVTYRNACISPDGTKMAFFRMATTPDLCLAKLDGTGLVVVHRFTSVQDAPTWWTVIWSPDGSKLLFGSNSRAEDLLYIDLIDDPSVIKAVPVDLVANGGPITITGDLDANTPGYQGKLAIGGPATLDSNDSLWQTIHILDLTFDATGVPQLGLAFQTIHTDYDIYRLAWSPNGKYLAYSAMSWEVPGVFLRLIQFAYDEVGKAIPVGDFIVDDGENGWVRNTSRITWSPDSQFIACAKKFPGQQFGYDEIARGAVREDDLGNPYLDNVLNLTNTPKGHEGNPDWSPAWNLIP